MTNIDDSELARRRVRDGYTNIAQGAREAGLTEIALNPRSVYVDSLVDWHNPLYQKILGNLPTGTKANDYTTSLEVKVRKPGAGCSGEECCRE